MLIPSGRTLYLAEKDNLIAGVFSSPENAQAAPHERLTAIEPLMLTGSPDAPEYVCMAKGVQIMLTRKGDEFSVLHIDLGPYWACNPQSAAAQFCPCSCKKIEISEFYLIRIDQPYTDQPLKSLHREQPFWKLLSAVPGSVSLPDELLSTDYIEKYLSEQTLRAERASAPAVPELNLAAELLMNIASKRATSGGQRIICGFSLGRAHGRLLITLAQRFTCEKLKRLCLLLQPDSETSPEEADMDLLRRAAECIPHVRTYRSVKDYLD